MTRWGVFDIDGTLFPGGSLERSFIRRMLAGGMLPPQNIAHFLFSTAGDRLTGRTGHSFRANKTYLAGLNASAIQNAAAAFCREQIEPGLSPEGLQEIARLRDEGYRIMLLSGAPDYLAGPLALFLKPDFLICTRLEVVRQHFTGRICGEHPYGITKRQLLLDVAPRLEIDFHHSRVFANHHSDAHHMRLFGSVTAVNPTRKLRRIARRGGWEITFWKRSY